MDIQTKANSGAISEVTHSPMVSGGVIPFYGTLTIAYLPDRATLDPESLDNCLNHTMQQTNHPEIFLRRVYDACRRALGDVPLQAKLEYTSHKHSPVALIINGDE